MSLDRAYRRLLLAYPARWWDERGEEVLTVLLEGAEARGARRPSAGEAADLIAHGLLARAGRLGGAMRADVDDRARELTAALALASLTALSLLCLVFGEWWPWTSVGGGLAEPLSSFSGTPGPFWTIGGPLMVLLLVPAALSLAGLPRLARGLLAASVPVIVATPAVAAVLGWNRPAWWALAGLLLFAVLSLAAPVRRRLLLGGLVAGLSGVTILVVYGHLQAGFDPRPGFYYGYLLQSLALAVPVGVLAAVAMASARRAIIPACLVGSAWLITFAGRLVSAAADTTGALLYLAAAAALGLVALASASYHRLMHDRQPALS